MTELPKTEIMALGVRDDFKSVRIMELGNKQNSSGLYRNWYESRGAAYMSTDINGEDGAIPWDIREDIPDEIAMAAPFDIVTNFGFTEHVQDRQADCWRNIHDMVHPNNGQLSCVLPAPGSWPNHGVPSGYPGRWYPHPAFFIEFAKANGYVIDDLWSPLAKPGRSLVCCRMHRKPGRVPDQFFFSSEFMYDNVSKPDFDGELIW